MSPSSRPSPDARALNGARGGRAASVPAWRRAWNAVSDSLREHPIFDLEDGDESSRPGVVDASGLTEARREPLYQAQWLRIFAVRLRLAAGVGILSLLLFVGFYFVLFPGLDRRMIGVTAVVIAGLVLQFFLTFRVRTLAQMRVLTLLGFALFSISSALALTLVDAREATGDIEAARAVQFVLTASFSHILIATLILPLRLRDTLVISAIVVGALGWGLRAMPEAMRTISTAGALWVVGTFALFVTLLSHFNSRLRRRVFDSAFDLTLQALKLKAISETDALTGGYNRRHCERVLRGELVRGARFGHTLSLLMFDLDNFKPVNDTLGHAAGDRVLIAVHEAAKGELREVDDLSRIGGDEFLILLPETEQKQAERIARRLHTRVLRELEIRFGRGSLLGRVTISIGALTLEVGHDLDAETVLDRVDELLYSAKHEGKNRVMLGREGG